MLTCGLPYVVVCTTTSGCTTISCVECHEFASSVIVVRDGSACMRLQWIPPWPLLGGGGAFPTRHEPILFCSGDGGGDGVEIRSGNSCGITYGKGKMNLI